MLMTYRLMHANWTAGYVAGSTVPKLPSPLKSVAQLMFHGPRNQVTVAMCWGNCMDGPLYTTASLCSLPTLRVKWCHVSLNSDGMLWWGLNVCAAEGPQGAWVQHPSAACITSVANEVFIVFLCVF